MINVTIKGQEEVISNFKELTPRTVEKLVPTIHGILVDLQRHVVADKLRGGTPLHARSGRLSGNINISGPFSDSTSVKGQVGTNVEYAAIHEYGGTIPAHDIFPKNKQALSFFWDKTGANMVLKHVHIPTIKMPERSFLRSALADYKELILTRIRNAVSGK